MISRVVIIYIHEQVYLSMTRQLDADTVAAISLLQISVRAHTLYSEHVLHLIEIAQQYRIKN